jgi:hypothetical protein
MAMVVAVEALSVVRGMPKTYVKKAEQGRSADRPRGRRIEGGRLPV